jgi:hypothetical protein
MASALCGLSVCRMARSFRPRRDPPRSPRTRRPPCTYPPPSRRPRRRPPPLIDRAAGVLGAVYPGQLRALLSIHGADALEMALRHIEAMDRPPRNPWALFVSILDDWREQGAVVRIPAGRPRGPRSDDPRDFMNNYNPGIGRKDVAPSTVVFGDWRATFGRITGEDYGAAKKNPAPGSLGKVPPEPVP